MGEGRGIRALEACERSRGMRGGGGRGITCTRVASRIMWEREFLLKAPTSASASPHVCERLRRLCAGADEGDKRERVGNNVHPSHLRVIHIHSPVCAVFLSLIVSAADTGNAAVLAHASTPPFPLSSCTIKLCNISIPCRTFLMLLNEKPVRSSYKEHSQIHLSILCVDCHVRISARQGPGRLLPCLVWTAPQVR